MTKFIKRLLLVCCFAALFVCGALLTACGEEETPPPGGEVSVPGQIVFEGDEYDEYSRDITLSFMPNGADVQGVTAELSYTDEEGKTASENFTLSRGENGYSLTDGSGKNYALDLAWGCANSADDHAVVHGEFLVTDTLEDYEAHEEGSRHYIEEGYFGAGALDVSGRTWFYNLEDMPSMSGPYLRFYITPDELLEREWDRTSAHGITWIYRAEDNGNEYLIYYFLVTENGVRKTLVYDVQFFDAHAETADFHHYYGEFFFKNGMRLYVSDLIEAGKVGDEVMTLFVKDGFQWADGTLHPKIYPCYGMTYGNDGGTDWMRYCFTLPEEDDPVVEEFYFELDEEGDILLATAQMGCHVWYQNREKTWGYDAFYTAPSQTEIVFKMLFGLGRVGEDGETDYFEDPLIVKRANGEFTVYAEGEAWNVSLGLNEEEYRIAFKVEEAEEAVVEGKIVFDEDSERKDHDFDEEITLRFTPIEGRADGAAATLVYSDGAGNAAARGGYTLVASGSDYVLCDEAGHEYDVELQWTPGGTENSVTICGEFVAEEEIKDYEGAMNAVYYGYFGLDGVQISHKMWWLQFGEVPREKTKCLNIYNPTILDAPYYVDPVYGEYYDMYNFIPGDGGYLVELYLKEKNGSRCLLVKSVRYIPENLVWTTAPISVNDGYEEAHWEEYAITKSTLLYSAKIFGLEKGAEFYTPYDCSDPTHMIARQDLCAIWKGENGEHDRMYFKDEEVGLLFYVDLDENEEIVRIHKAYAGFFFDFKPDLSIDRPYAFGAFLLSNEVDIYTPNMIYEFGYMKSGTLFYPSDTKIVKNEDNTFTVKESGADGQTLNEWKVYFTDLGAEVPVPHVAEVATTLDYSLSFNWAYAETGASQKDADVFFVAPSSVAGREEQEILNFSYTSARRAFKGAIDMEKGIYDDNARFFAPYYRQAVLYDYSLEKAELEEYLAYAYSDVRNAFLYYMGHWNGGRPVILAGFSQGADHCIRLMKEFFGKTGEDGRKDLLVACYAIGWCITEQELTENNLKFASDATGTGVIISFNTEAENVTDSLTVPNGTKALCINPLNWRTDTTRANKSQNKGACFFDLNGNLLEVKEHLTGAYIDDVRGTLKVPDTDIDPAVYNNTLGGFVDAGVYHYYDYQFFYKNLEENVLARIAAYKAAHV